MPVQFPQSNESLGIHLNMEECETHRRALKSKNFSDSNFMLIAVAEMKGLEFQMKRFSN